MKASTRCDRSTSRKSNTLAKVRTVLTTLFAAVAFAFVFFIIFDQHSSPALLQPAPKGASSVLFVF